MVFVPCDGCPGCIPAFCQMHAGDKRQLPTTLICLSELVYIFPVKYPYISHVLAIYSAVQFLQYIGFEMKDEYEVKL